MNDKDVDQGKGRLTRTARSPTDDKRRNNENRRDQAKSSAKKTVQKVVDTLPGRGTE
jgi:uncharacterized protein YjbJ (UPF0337 family)